LVSLLSLLSLLLPPQVPSLGLQDAARSAESVTWDSLVPLTGTCGPFAPWPHRVEGERAPRLPSQLGREGIPKPEDSGGGEDRWQGWNRCQEVRELRAGPGRRVPSLGAVPSPTRPVTPVRGWSHGGRSRLGADPGGRRRGPRSRASREGSGATFPPLPGAPFPLYLRRWRGGAARGKGLAAPGLAGRRPDHLKVTK
jgi:hypothetical protein